MSTIRKLLARIFVHEPHSESETVALLRSIDARLRNIEDANRKLEKCVTEDNHKSRPCLRMGHWNS